MEFVLLPKPTQRIHSEMQMERDGMMEWTILIFTNISNSVCILEEMQ